MPSSSLFPATAASSLSLNSLEMDLASNHVASSAAAPGSHLLDDGSNTRTMQLALELALLQGQQSSSSHFDASPGHVSSSSHLHSDNPLIHPFGIPGAGSNPGHVGASISACNGAGGSLEDLKTRRSQNMTECVPVPTSEHVAEIVGRQGKKEHHHHHL